MSVQSGPQPLLVKEMGNQTDTAAKNEQSVEDTHLQVVFSLFRSESTSAAHEVNEADGDGTVDVEDEVVLLAGGDGLDGDGVVEELGRGEVGLAELLDERDTEIGVVAGLDPVADTGDCGVVRKFAKSGNYKSYSACFPSSWCRQSHGG